MPGAAHLTARQERRCIDGYCLLQEEICQPAGKVFVSLSLEPCQHSVEVEVCCGGWTPQQTA